MSQALAKLNTGDLAALTPHLALGPEAAAATQGCTQITDALDRLDGAGYLTEATRLIAHALPKREAVWWACMCAGHTAPADLPAADRVAREAAEDLVRQQTDHSRRIASGSRAGRRQRHARGLGGDRGVLERRFDVAGGPTRRPAGGHLAGTAAAGAVALASVRGDVTRRQERLRRFLESGRNIAAGGPGRLPAETA